MTTHELKTVQPFFSEVFDWKKTFEVRVNDRDFRTGDILVLREWSPERGYTGAVAVRRVGFVLDGGKESVSGAIAPGFCVLSLL